MSVYPDNPMISLWLAGDFYQNFINCAHYLYPKPLNRRDVSLEKGTPGKSGRC